MSIETDLQKILGADVSAYIAALDAQRHASNKEDTAHAAAVALVKPAHDRMRAAFAKVLRPHRVEWTPYPALCVDWANNKSTASFSGDVWPATKSRKGYSMQARPHIRFNVTPRDADEWRRFTAMMKAMADAATDGGL
jgi:hypothetical protein